VRGLICRACTISATVKPRSDNHHDTHPPLTPIRQQMHPLALAARASIGIALATHAKQEHPSQGQPEKSRFFTRSKDGEAT
jgi:hypothetical protein